MPAMSTPVCSQPVHNRSDAVCAPAMASDSKAPRQPINRTAVATEMMALQMARADEEETNTLNVIVAGHQGLGKTSAARSIFKAFTDDTALIEAGEQSATAECKAIRDDIKKKKCELQDLLKAEVEAGINQHDCDKAINLCQQAKACRAEIDRLETELDEAAARARQKTQQLKKLNDNIVDLNAETKEAEARKDWLQKRTLQERLSELKHEADMLREELRRHAEVTQDVDAQADSQTLQILRKKWEFPIIMGPKTLKVTITDTPGFGDSTNVGNEIKPVVDEVEKQFVEYEKARHAGGIHFTELEKLDPLYHVCLYFIQPHRFSRLDEKFMRELSPYTNIVPVLAKADTMNQAELQNFRRQVQEKLSEANLLQPPYEFDQHHIDKYVQRLGESDQANIKERSTDYGRMPLALISPAENSEVREYLWGTAQPENPLHSDLGCLRHMIVKAEPYKLRDSTKRLFNEWSTAQREAQAQREAEEAEAQREAETQGDTGCAIM